DNLSWIIEYTAGTTVGNALITMEILDATGTVLITETRTITLYQEILELSQAEGNSFTLAAGETKPLLVTVRTADGLAPQGQYTLHAMLNDYSGNAQINGEWEASEIPLNAAGTVNFSYTAPTDTTTNSERILTISILGQDSIAPLNLTFQTRAVLN